MIKVNGVISGGLIARALVKSYRGQYRIERIEIFADKVTICGTILSQ